MNESNCIGLIKRDGIEKLTYEMWKISSQLVKGYLLFVAQIRLKAKTRIRARMVKEWEDRTGNASFNKQFYVCCVCGMHDN